MIESRNNYLGNYYPFFLNNYSLTDQHYLYQFYSPGMSKDFNPYISMVKISEKTHYGNPGRENDILRVCAGKDEKNDTKITPLEYLEGMFNSVRLFAGSCLGISPLAPEAEQQHKDIYTGGRLRC